jgi:hypothetical protein
MILAESEPTSEFKHISPDDSKIRGESPIMWRVDFFLHGNGRFKK